MKSLVDRLSFTETFTFEVSAPAETVAKMLLNLYEQHRCDVQIIETVNDDYRFTFQMKQRGNLLLGFPTVIAEGNILPQGNCSLVQGLVWYGRYYLVTAWLPPLVLVISFITGLLLLVTSFNYQIFNALLTVFGLSVYFTFVAFAQWAMMSKDRSLLFEKMQQLLSNLTSKRKKIL